MLFITLLWIIDFLGSYGIIIKNVFYLRNWSIKIMPKRIIKRYLSENDVKRALKIDTFRNVSKEKLMEFASMIPYMDKDVAISIINQFPVFADFGKIAISSYLEICNNILEKNNEIQLATVEGYKIILESLSNRMNKESLSEEERKLITNDMITVADKIAEVNIQNKKFLERMGTKVVFGILGVVAIIGAAIGVNSTFGGGNDLPQLEEDDEDDKDDE